MLYPERTMDKILEEFRAAPSLLVRTRMLNALNADRNRIAGQFAWDMEVLGHAIQEMGKLISIEVELELEEERKADK